LVVREQRDFHDSAPFQTRSPRRFRRVQMCAKRCTFWHTKNLFIYNTNSPSFQGVIFLPPRKIGRFSPKNSLSQKVHLLRHYEIVSQKRNDRFPANGSGRFLITQNQGPLRFS
ncbi:MAG: hypothetical protein IJ741_09610, partial [Schwartzia sp.]|nr:hypothetical protein [Schwartzia sp. (in: firmicutes)]